MRLQAMTDDAVAAAIGGRIQALRLKKNISQEEVAKEAGISRQTLLNLLHGKCTLVNLIAVLRVLSELERVSSLVEDVRPSPLQVMKLAGNKRVRATGTRAARTSSGKIASAKVTSAPGKAKKDTAW